MIKRRNQQHSSERGQASMVTVAMFMMLFAIVAVSFTYIVVDTTRQAANDTLQSVAKSAAESGVEDAKRLLVYCYSQQTGTDTYSTPTAQSICTKVVGNKLEDLGCQDILQQVNDTNLSGFVTEEDGNGGYRAKVGGDDSESDGSSTEYYQCLKIATRTLTYQGVANANSDSAIVPLRLVNADGVPTNPARIEISWHRNSSGENGDQPVNGLSSGIGLPTQSTWNNSGNRPAIVRAEVVGAPKNNVSVESLISNDAAVTLRPVNGTPGTSIAIMNYKPAQNDYDGNNDAPNNQYGGSAPILAAGCSNDTSQNYACVVNLTGGDGGGAFDIQNFDYYLRLNAIYKDTHFSISAYSSTGERLYFDGVQPVIDVTGKSADSFSRIQANLEPTYSDDDNKWWPEYAIETQGRVCKDMTVFYDDADNSCE